MYAQGSTAFSEAPNLIAPRFAFDLMNRGRIGQELKHARSPMLVVMAEGDDLIPPKITKSVVENSAGSECCLGLLIILNTVLTEVQLVSIPCGHFEIMKGGSVSSLCTRLTVEITMGSTGI